MKRKIKIVAVALSITMALGCLFACKKASDDKGTVISEFVGKDNSANHVDDSIAVANKYFLKDGKTDYKIVLPVNASDREVEAKEELVEFFKQATGVTLSTVTDAGLSHSDEAKYISIGETSLVSEAGVTVPYAEFGSDGYKIESRGDSVFLLGGEGDGTLYSVYHFLNKLVDYKFYSIDEIYYRENVREIPYLRFAIREIPDFAQRMLGLYEPQANYDYKTRLRVDKHGEQWAFGSHSHFKILPKETYYDKHPDWYSPAGTQLCLTNEEMRKQFVENVKELVASLPNIKYMSLGAQDLNVFCECDNCKAAIAQYGTPSAVDMRFVNAVARDIKAWLDETQPGRDLTFVALSYFQTLTPPAHKNEDGEWVPNDPSVVAEPNVAVQIAPLHANYSYEFHTPENQETADALDGWSAVTDNITVWSYSANFWNYSVNFAQWGTMATHYREYYSAGATVLFDQGAWNTPSVSFDAMRAYVQSQLMWNTALSYDELVAEFMQHYYHEAGDAMFEYYNVLKSYQEGIRQKYPKVMDANCYVDVINADYWSKGFLDQCMRIFDKAYAAIENSDPLMYETLYTRIKIESLSTTFLILNLYTAYYTTAQLTTMIDEFELYANMHGIMWWRETSTESYSIANLVAGWREKI
ncbi:MAG: DUF4838 domain-containing protein [Clostridia bacterium]|nr:DUF4838 domain-containing protein [Clostridia bacterium]